MSEVFHNEQVSPTPEEGSVWRDLSGLTHVVKHVNCGFSRSVETRDVHGRKHRFSLDEFSEFEAVNISIF